MRLLPFFLGLLFVALGTGCQGLFFSTAPLQTPEADALAAAARLATSNKEVYPRGKLFPFSFYSLNTEIDRPSRLNLLGPYGKIKNVTTARTLGIKTVFTVGLPMDFLSETPLRLSDEEIRQQITQQVADAAANPEIAWWYLTPEEIRYWRKDELNYLKVAAQAIRDADPLRRPIWLYEPNHRTAEAMAHLVPHLDIVGKGIYTNFVGKTDERSFVRWSIEEEIRAIEIAKSRAIPIAVLEMFRNAPDGQSEKIPHWVRHDAYLALVSGAKGLVIYSGARRNGFTDFEAYLQAYSKLGEELNGSRAYGQVFLFGEKQNQLSVSVIEGPPTVNFSTLEKPAKNITYPSVSLAHYRYDGKNYLFLVNSSNSAVNTLISGFASPPQGQDVFKNIPIAAKRTTIKIFFRPLEVRCFVF